MKKDLIEIKEGISFTFGWYISVEFLHYQTKYSSLFITYFKDTKSVMDFSAKLQMEKKNTFLF